MQFMHVHYEHKIQNQYMKEMLSKAFNKKQSTQNFTSKQEKKTF